MRQLDLLDRTPSCRVVPFPTDKRVGHARRVAEQLDHARTNKEADSRLTRACQTLKRQMREAGISGDEIDRQSDAYLLVISVECERIRARWSPVLPEDERQGPRPGGAA